MEELKLDIVERVKSRHSRSGSLEMGIWGEKDFLCMLNSSVFEVLKQMQIKFWLKKDKEVENKNICTCTIWSKYEYIYSWLHV